MLRHLARDVVFLSLNASVSSHRAHAGARTIGQDEASCIVYGMPKVAYELGAVERQLPLSKIAEGIVQSL
ncbi:chemotaxis protein CheB [Sulfuricurvum sp. IAE1]|uniref:chemotaxis protein CheB n=1 Tax=Sulfuricurvum sp. IAE1 TaxID=2546102 RepID=UPI0014055C81|nr:chemotaxis protein CheB [Sulfuricurvum sp. IAE1]